jgi:hypothetical protein
MLRTERVRLDEEAPAGALGLRSASPQVNGGGGGVLAQDIRDRCLKT